MNQRNGTDMDAGNAMQVFKKLGYKVQVYNDQSMDQIKQVLSAGKLVLCRHMVGKTAQSPSNCGLSRLCKCIPLVLQLNVNLSITLLAYIVDCISIMLFILSCFLYC